MELIDIRITKEDFHSENCYKLFVYAMNLAIQVNEYIDKGYLVYEDKRKMNKFSFKSNVGKKISIGELDGNVFLCWIGNVTDKSGKLVLTGEYTKRSLKKLFSQITIVNPKNIEKLKF